MEVHTRMHTEINSNPGMFFTLKWGHPILVEQAGLSVHLIEDLGFPPSNFQPLPLLPVREDDNGNYVDNSGTYSAISNSLKIPHEDILRVEVLQPDDGVGAKQKMQWWCYPGAGTRPAWCKSPKDAEGNWIYDYSNTPMAFWGTIAIGGRPIQIDKTQFVNIQLPARNKREDVLMGRVVCFRKSQWGISPDEYPHLIQRQAGAGNNDVYIDHPKGTIYAPLFDPRDWDFAGAYQPNAFYIPVDWLTKHG